ncbi:MAG: helix-turn-helix transcriptional regulator [Peptostreptococcaceae bacterium]|nr:helix-turn-helix transcriptional regulator [Peptostreptococcaceae bacterium]
MELVKENLKISLKAARVNAELTIINAAKIIGIGKDTLIKWEKEPWKVNALYQKKISEAYEFPIDHIKFLT